MVFKGNQKVGTQSRLESLIESIIQTSTGFIVSLLTWILIVDPLFGFNTNFVQSFSISCIFWFVSVVRQYSMRRFFNNNQHKTVAKKIASGILFVYGKIVG